MSLNKFVLLLIATLCVATTALAAGKSREFAMDANFVDVQGESASSILNVSLGQFLSPQVVIVTALRSHSNFGYTGTTIGFGGKYYFMDGFRGDLVPFAGLGLGLRVKDSNRASTEYDFNGGLAFFMADNTTLDAKIRLLSFNDSSPIIIIFGVGFSQRF